MGRSIEFIMQQRDEEKFIEYLNDSGDIAIVSAASKACFPEVLKNFYTRDSNIFWNKAYLARDCDLGRLKLSKVASCNHYIIEDTYEAPVIEIRRCTNALGHARLYAEFYYFKDGVEIYKGEEFENLYKNIERWIRINYRLIEPGCSFNAKYCYY